jgi:hypothetical protein
MTPYEIRIRGRLTRSLARDFARMQLDLREERDCTLLTGLVEDQSALYGILRRLESLGLELVDVRRIDTSDD